MPRSSLVFFTLLVGIAIGYLAHDRLRRELPGAADLRSEVRAYGNTLVLFDPQGRVPGKRIQLDGEIAHCLAMDTPQGRRFIAGTRAYGADMPGKVYAFDSSGNPAWKAPVNPHDPLLLQPPEGTTGLPEPTVSPVDDIHSLEVQRFFGEDRDYLAVWSRPRSFAVARFMVLEPTTGEIVYSFINWGTPWQWVYGDWGEDGVQDMLIASHVNGLAYRISGDLDGIPPSTYFRAATLLTPAKGAWNTGPGFARRDQIQGGFQWAVIHLPFADGQSVGGMNTFDVKLQSVGGIRRAYIDFPGDCIYMLDHNLGCETIKSPHWVRSFAGREPPPLIVMTTDPEGRPSTRLLRCGPGDAHATLAAFYDAGQMRILDRLLEIQAWW